MRKIIGKLILWFLKGQRIHIYDATIKMGMNEPCQIIGLIKFSEEDQFGNTSVVIKGEDLIK